MLLVIFRCLIITTLIKDITLNKHNQLWKIIFGFRHPKGHNSENVHGVSVIPDRADQNYEKTKQVLICLFTPGCFFVCFEDNYGGLVMVIFTICMKMNILIA